MRKTTIFLTILVIAVLAGAVGWYVMNQNNADETDEAANTSQTSQVAEETQPVEQSQPTESTKLAAVGSYTGSATATRTTEGKYIHTVTAKMGDPADGDFYEGWLTDGSDVISTGKMVMEAEGEWSLTFTSSRDLSKHNTVVITEETGANGLDNVPEDHVLEGGF